MIRLFAHATDTGDTSALALAYVDALVAAKVPLRVISTEILELWDEEVARRDASGRIVVAARAAHRWLRHRRLFVVPVIAPYINAVCTTPAHWGRLYTVGVRNVLLTDHPPNAHGKQYQQVIVPTDEIALEWHKVLEVDQIAVVPVALGPQLAILTNALFGPEYTP